MAFIGKWEAFSYDNFDGGLKAAGIPDELLKPASGSTLVMEFAQNGDLYQKTESVNVRLSENEFKSGEPFICQNFLDQTQNWTISVDGDKVVEKRKIDNKTLTYTYEMKDGQLEARCQQVGLAPCTIKFKRV